jgi:hypothetical protein
MTGPQSRREPTGRRRAIAGSKHDQERPMPSTPAATQRLNRAEDPSATDGVARALGSVVALDDLGHRDDLATALDSTPPAGGPRVAHAR